MFASDAVFLMHGLLVVALLALMAAMVVAFPLIWSDFKRDLDRRVEEDAWQEPPAPFDHELDLELRDSLEREAAL